MRHPKETIAKMKETLNMVDIGCKALKWYLRPSRAGQYSGKTESLYHNAADLLTGRSQFAHNLVAFINSGNPNGSTNRILEIASGTGLISTVLEQSFPNSQKVFSDISPDALNLLRDTLGNEGIATVVADFHNLPFGDNEFNLIVDVGGYRYMQDPSQFWTEITRTLRSGGRYILAQFVPPIGINGRNVAHDLKVNPNVTNLQLTRKIKQLATLRTSGIPTGFYQLYEFTKKP